MRSSSGSLIGRRLIGRRRTPSPAAGLLLGVALAIASATPGGAQLFDPVRANGELWLREIYDVARWSLRVPVDLATPYLVRLKLDPWLDELPLAPEVRERLRAHVHSAEFVDEVVPFLIAVKEMYTAPPDAAEQTFDANLRRRYSAADAIPGMEHSMFSWRPAPASDRSDVALDGEVAADLLGIYDAIYLQDEAAEAHLGDRLRCAVEPAGDRLRAIVARVEPRVRRLLEAAASRLDPAGEFEPALRAILRDPDRLEAVTVSLLDLIRQQTCKHYGVFATRVFREEQLRSWMLEELDRPGGGRLWEFLAWAQDERRYAVHVVVDGLEGRLVEALASGDAADPFLGRVLQESREAAARAPHGVRSSPMPRPSTRFLERVARDAFDRRDYLPFFRRLYAHANAVAHVGISTTPTISIRNLPIAQTGATVAGAGGTGLPNFHFVDRHASLAGRAYYFYGNDAVLLDALTRNAGMRTLFERLPRLSSYACSAPYDRGAHRTLDSFLNLGVGERQRDFAELRCLPDLERRADTERALRELRARLLARRGALAEPAAWWNPMACVGRPGEGGLARREIADIARLEQDTIPEYLVYYNPWPDHFAHFKGPFADEIIAPSGELARLDHWLDRLAAVYERAGVADRTLFGMAGDHGLTPVFFALNPEVEVFDRLREKGTDFRVVKISSDEGEGPKLTNRLRPPSMRGIDVVVASTAGGNYMLDLFVDQDRAWSRQPVYGELRSVRPLAGGPSVDLVAELVTRLGDSLDYLVVRETACDAAGGTVRVVGMREGRRADGWITRRGDRVFYRFTGADLLDTARVTPYERVAAADRDAHAARRRRCVETAHEADPATWCTEEEWRWLTSWTPRPDGVGQLAHLYDVDLAGTVNLFPIDGVGYNTLVPGRHAGEAFHEKDAFVGVWGAPLGRGGRPRTAVNGSVAATLYEWLGGAPVVAGQDGWGFAPLKPGAD